MKIIDAHVEEIVFHIPEGYPSIEAWLERVGRICYQSADRITEESASKFIRMLRDRGHWAMLEHATISAIVIGDRGMLAEWTRHRIASYAVESSRYCVAGNTKLSIRNPHVKKTIEELYNQKITSKNGSWKRYSIKYLNLATGELEYSTPKDILFNGEREVIEITTRLGYKIVCTKDHKIYTKNGFVSADMISIGNEIAVNGINALYRNKDWLYNQYNTLNKTAPEIAKEFFFNENTIKKWVRIHGLPQKERSYWKKGTIPWNKNLREDDDPRVKSQANALREFHSNGYADAKKTKIDRIKKISEKTFHKLAKEYCELCGNKNKLNVHHIDENRSNNNIENFITLCPKCHGGIHNKNIQYVYYDSVVNIIPAGTQKVYDIVMNNEHHNYIANGIIVHNCNYSKGKFGGEITVIRQPGLTEDQETMWREAMYLSERYYLSLLEAGVKPDIARSVLPMALKTEMTCTANLREWAAIFNMRCDTPAHPIIRGCALEILRKLNERLPSIYEDHAERFLNETDNVK